MKEKHEYTIEDEIATEFVVDVITEAMKRFSITYNKVDDILTRLKYWDLFNDSGVTCVGAHEGIEPILKEIEEAL